MIAAPVVLVDPVISRQKLQREIALWESNGPHRERGWLLLRHDESALSVELAFFARLAISSGSGPLPAAVCAIRLGYENYDLWPPSLTFIDPLTRAPAKPFVRAFIPTPTGPQDALIDSHPDTGQPFLCIPGIREYHSHPQHTGDAWLLHRDSGEGSISTVCDRVWRYMVRNIVGLNVQLQSLPGWPLRAQLVIQVGQGNVTDQPLTAVKPALSGDSTSP